MKDTRGYPVSSEIDLKPYAGRWVAILRGRVVGQGGTPRQAELSARSSRYKEIPQIVFAPLMNEFSYHPLFDKIRSALPQDEEVYLVGGAVRDMLLKRPNHDLDFSVAGDGIAIGRKVANALQADFYQLDTERRTGRVILMHGESRFAIDFATFRGPDLESDLRARDFTLNALAVDAHDPQKVYDPLGGATDIQNKSIRLCSPNALKDDPIRILRAVRQAAELGFKLEADTRQAIKDAANLVTNPSGERQRDEILKILDGRNPATALRVLDLLGVLPHIFPDLQVLKGVEQSPPHVYDVWQHTLKTVEALENLLGFLGVLEHDEDAVGSFFIGLAIMRLGRYRKNIRDLLHDELIPERRWRALLFLAALYHDAGKPETASVDENGRIRFFDHEQAGATIIGLRANELKLSKEESQRMKAVVRHHMRPHHLVQSGRLPSRRAIFRFFRDTQLAGVDICLLNLADVMATYDKTLRHETWASYLDVIRELLESYWEHQEEKITPPSILTGHEVIENFGIAPGPKIGELLDRVREEQAAGTISTNEQALAMVKEILEKEPPAD